MGEPSLTSQNYLIEDQLDSDEAFRDTANEKTTIIITLPPHHRVRYKPRSARLANEAPRTFSVVNPSFQSEHHSPRGLLGLEGLTLLLRCRADQACSLSFSSSSVLAWSREANIYAVPGVSSAVIQEPSCPTVQEMSQQDCGVKPLRSIV